MTGKAAALRCPMASLVLASAGRELSWEESAGLELLRL